MTLNHQDDIVCSVCKSHQTFVVWDSINVTVDPALKRQLLAGELVNCRCNNCGHEERVEFNCLYHDMEKSLAIWLKYPETKRDVGSEEELERLSSFFASPYKCRLVSNFNNLVEKVNTFDFDLSDYAIELFKVVILAKEKLDLAKSMYFDRMETDSECKFVVLVSEFNGQWHEGRYSLQKLNETIAPLMPKIEPYFRLSGNDWPSVDRNLMLGALYKNQDVFRDILQL
jgi:hypothetical protein